MLLLWAVSIESRMNVIFVPDQLQAADPGLPDRKIRDGYLISAVATTPKYGIRPCISALPWTPARKREENRPPTRKPTDRGRTRA